VLKQKFVEEIASKVSEILAASPAKDVEKNLKAGLTALFAKLDLVTREEFDVQTQVLARTRERLSALEARISGLGGGQEPHPEPAAGPESAEEEDQPVQPS
jgi:BMFP domain-containing protein YqiC